MSDEEWVRGPFGPYAAEGGTCLSERTVLAVVHTVTAGTRLADVVPLLEPDPRVQVVYTWPPWSLASAGARRYLDQLGGVVVPWRQAAQVRFDLAVAASHGLLQQLHAPVLTVDHGAGHNKYPVRSHGDGPGGPREIAGLERGELIHRGRVVPSRIVVATRRDLSRLTCSCPEAATAGIVGGDPCYDRLAASMPLRGRYRRALGTGRRKLVAVSSTWGPGSLAQQWPDLVSQMMRELPADTYQVAAILHPNAWHWHSPRQVRAWHAENMRRGLLLIPPEEGWRAVLVAADVIVGDHGSVTYYGASTGVPVLLAAFPSEHVAPGSPVADLARAAPRLGSGRPIAPQLRHAARAWPPQRSAGIRAQITDAPGRAARIIRSVMYQMMNLTEPAAEPVLRPVPAPDLAASPGAFGATG